MPPMLRRWWWLPPLALLLLIAWGPAPFGPFHFDDDRVIVDYAPVHSLAGWWQAQPGLRPLLKLSYALNYSVDPGPFGFHVTNLCLHALNGVLLLLFLRRLLPAMPGVTLAVTALWLLHPSSTEAVTYVSGRSVALMTTFMLAALWAVCGDRPRDRWLAALFTALALAVRETAWSLPFALAIVAWMTASQRGTEARTAGFQAAWHLAWPRVWPSLAILGLAVVAFLLETRHRHLLLDNLPDQDRGALLWTQLEAWRWFAAQALWLAAPNFDPDLRPQWQATPALVLWGLLLATLVALSLRQLLRTHSLIAGSFLLAVIFLLPGYSVLMRPDMANNRHLYPVLPGLLLALLLAGNLLLATFAERTGLARVRMAGTALLMLLVLYSALATGLRNLDYLDERSLWQRTAEQSPDKSRVWNNLGMACEAEGDGDCARDAYRRAVQLDPANLRAKNNLYFLEWPE